MACFCVKRLRLLPGELRALGAHASFVGISHVCPSQLLLAAAADRAPLARAPASCLRESGLWPLQIMP